jgi:uncharacterized protein (TIGR03435 family)
VLKFLPLVLALALFGKIEAQKKPEFEVASIKPSKGGRTGCLGGPGSRDPDRLRCPNADLFFLICYAFNLQNWEFKALPWMHDQGMRDQAFEVLANIPQGTTRDDFLLMFQTLLEQRFHLTYHREAGHVQGYRLVVAKSGPKLIFSPPTVHRTKFYPQRPRISPERC